MRASGGSASQAWGALYYCLSQLFDSARGNPRREGEEGGSHFSSYVYLPASTYLLLCVYIADSVKEDDKAEYVFEGEHYSIREQKHGECVAEDLSTTLTPSSLSRRPGSSKQRRGPRRRRSARGRSSHPGPSAPGRPPRRPRRPGGPGGFDGINSPNFAKFKIYGVCTVTVRLLYGYCTVTV